MMKKTLYLLLILLFPFNLFCQNPYWARLSIKGSVSELGISPSEEIWAATVVGNVYYTKQIGELWKIGPFGSLDPYHFQTGETFERINFFSEDTLMISGFIQEGGRQDFVYWSGNHGRTWDKVRFGKSSWIDAAYINSNGKAWMSGSSQLIYHTKDRGRTWKEFGKVEPNGNLRFSTIYFAKDEKTGLFGSFWNVLYRTKDNCRSWEKLPTPLSQNKYHRISKEDRPDIRKIRMFGHYYIVNQQGRIFISRSDNLVWKYLPNVMDFEVSESERLYTISRDLSVELFDSSFSFVWKSSQKVDGFPRALAVKNESLFTLTFENLYKVNPEEFRVSSLLTDEIPIPEPYLKVLHRGKSYGFDNRDVLQYDKKRKQWFRWMTLDFPITNATVFKNDLIVSGGMLNQYYLINESLKTIEKYDLPNNLFDANKNQVVEFHLEQGSQGCFHSDNARKSFVRKKDQFVLDKKSTASKYLSKTNTEIDGKIINQLVKILNQSRFSRLALSDLHITEKEVSAFKKFIDKEAQRIQKSGIDRFNFDNLYDFPGENTDFEFYKRVADSLFTISEEQIDSAFWQAYGHWSTTTDWRRIIFVFDAGKRLIVENSDDKPNYLYTPWMVDYDGLKYRTNSIQFGQIINELTKGEFFLEITRDKNYAIFKIADYLYQKKIREK